MRNEVLVSRLSSCGRLARPLGLRTTEFCDVMLDIVLILVSFRDCLCTYNILTLVRILLSKMGVELSPS